MTAPEKLWLLWREGGHVKGRVVASEMDHSDEGFPEYIRADLLDAHIGAVLAEAAAACEAQKAAFLDPAYPAYTTPQPVSSFSKRFACDECASAILALRPTAVTALDRAKREARVEGMQAALGFDRHGIDQETADKVCAAICALIEAERGKP